MDSFDLLLSQAMAIVFLLVSFQCRSLLQVVLSFYEGEDCAWKTRTTNSVIHMVKKTMNETMIILNYHAYQI